MAMTTAEKITKLRIVLGTTPTDDLLEWLIEQVEDIAMSIVYPYEDTTLTPFPTKYDLWTIRACKEMYDHLGMDGVKSYSENGLSITYDTLVNGISTATLNQLTPRVGVPK